MKNPSTSCVYQKEKSTFSLHRKRSPEAAPAPSTPRLEIRTSGLMSGEGKRSHWPGLDGAAPFRDTESPNPVIARSPCDEAIQGLLHVALRRLPRTRFRTILSAFANRPSGISMPRTPCVYIIASDRNGTHYTGVTSNLLPQRIHQHREGLGEGFTRRHRRQLLVVLQDP
jgi:hypothetical protein